MSNDMAVFGKSIGAAGVSSRLVFPSDRPRGRLIAGPFEGVLGGAGGGVTGGNVGRPPCAGCVSVAGASGDVCGIGGVIGDAKGSCGSLGACCDFICGCERDGGGTGTVTGIGGTTVSNFACCGGKLTGPSVGNAGAASTAGSSKGGTFEGRCGRGGMGGNSIAGRP